MRGRYRGGRSRGWESGEQRREESGRREQQRGYPEGGWGDEREWEGMSGEGSSMGGYRGARGRGSYQGGGYQGEGRGYQRERYRGGFQGGYGWSGPGYQGQYDEEDSEELGYQGRGYQGSREEGEFESRGGYGRQGRWGGRPERSFPGSSAFGGGSGGYGREYEGGYGRGFEGRGYGSQEQGSEGSGGLYGREWGERQQERSRGQFSGRGPKGYQRSDERIREDVSEALSRHGDIDASEITVEVRGGEVILAGTVDSRDAKREAERCVENEPGVKEVQNQLRVQEKRQESSRQGTESGVSERASAGVERETPTSRSRSRESSALGANL